jgi:hypothetical protein
MKNLYIQLRLSKWVTNGSKTAVMDVIGFLCISLVTAQTSFITIWVADVHTYVQRLVSVVKMEAVLEEYTTG